MKKLFFLTGNMSHAGGTERVVSVIAGELAKKGYQIGVISLWGRGGPFFPFSQRIKFIWVEDRVGRYNVCGQLKYLLFLLREERADFLVDVDSILGVYSVILQRMLPNLRWVSWEHFSSQHHFDKNVILRKLAKRLVFRFADRLIVLTETDRVYYERNYNIRCGLTCIPNPLPFEPGRGGRTEQPIIVGAGRLTDVKGFDLLIDSWRTLEARYPEWSVLIAGEGEDREKLEKRAAEYGLGRIWFLGNLSLIEELYQKASFLVFPSRQEGFGMVLIEAMCFGLPAVSYACESGPREIIQDGENGFLVEVGNTDEFAAKMEVLMKDAKLRSQMGKRAEESVRRFEKERIVEQWVEILRD